MYFHGHIFLLFFHGQFFFSRATFEKKYFHGQFFFFTGNFFRFFSRASFFFHGQNIVFFHGEDFGFHGQKKNAEKNSHGAPAGAPYRLKVVSQALSPT